MKKEITLCGKQVQLMYCAAAENGFEELAGKSINKMDFTRSSDIMHLALACIIAAYTSADQEPPITAKDLLYDANPKELTDLYLTVINLRAEWYGLPQTVSEQLRKEEEQMSPEEKEDAEKNA